MLKLLIPALLLAATNALAASSGCDEKRSYEDAVGCLLTEVSNADAAMTRYLDASKRRHAADKLRMMQIESSQQLWLKMRGIRCNPVNLLPRDEKKHTAELLYCMNWITRERTHQIWESFLRTRDGAPPELPEPKR